MNEILIKNWNETVDIDATVYYLGDFSLAFRPVELYTNRLNGKKILIPGNHDFCHSYHKKSKNLENRQKWIQKYVDCGWIVENEQVVLNIPGIATFNLCHHPYVNGEESHHGDKYAKWRPIDDGRWLLHGHTHSLEQKHLDKHMINIGVDAWNYKPVSIKEISNLITNYEQEQKTQKT